MLFGYFFLNLHHNIIPVKIILSKKRRMVSLKLNVAKNLVKLASLANFKVGKLILPQQNHIFLSHLLKLLTQLQVDLKLKSLY